MQLMAEKLTKLQQIQAADVSSLGRGGCRSGRRAGGRILRGCDGGVDR